MLLTVFEGRRLKSGSLSGKQDVDRAMLPGGSVGRCVPCLSQLPVAAGIPWLVTTSLLSSRPASSNLSLSIFVCGCVLKHFPLLKNMYTKSRGGGGGCLS